MADIQDPFPKGITNGKHANLGYFATSVAGHLALLFKVNHLDA